jgi:ABC-2 type transport system permease protein
MRLVLVHTRASILELVRYPSFSVPTLTFPALLFALLVAPRNHDRPDVLMASFCGFAVLAVALFQFGVGIALERESPWELFLRTLPVATAARFAARVASAASFALAAAAVVAVTATATTSARLGPLGWLCLALVLLAGAVPFALLGVALGYLAPPRGALPLANIVYLLLSVGGGLWVTASHVPRPLDRVSSFVPTRPYAQLLGDAVEGHVLVARPWAVLAGWSAVFGAVALWGYRRDEGRRWR